MRVGGVNECVQGIPAKCTSTQLHGNGFLSAEYTIGFLLVLIEMVSGCLLVLEPHRQPISQDEPDLGGHPIAVMKMI